jgi:pyruvate dehydrogenase E2 component (dihydrolipoamide acetyltransferase)
MARSDVVMPRLSDTMEEGVVVVWLKKLGDSVQLGDEIVEIETDKVTATISAEVEGVLLEVLCAEGEAAAPGSVIAVLGSSAEDKGSQGAPESSEEGRTSLPREYSGTTSERTDSLSLPRPRLTERPQSFRPERVIATPAARTFAAQVGVDLETIESGSGPAGRILLHDVEKAVEGTQGDARDEQAELAPGDVVRAVSRIQRLTASRMADSKREIPHFYLTVEVDMTAVRRVCAETDTAEESITITDLVVWACGRAIRETPDVNVRWAQDGIHVHSAVNVGVAVALETGDLLVPVVSDADLKPLGEISREVRVLAERARAGRLELSDLEGGTFTVSSLGMFGIQEFYPIILPQQSGILGVGAIQKHLVLTDGEVQEHETMRISLSADHRAFSGATAANFLKGVRHNLEESVLEVIEKQLET